MGAVGFSVACTANLARKLPAMRQPWEHVILAGAGYYVGSKMPGWKETNRREVAKLEGGREALEKAQQLRIFGAAQ